MLVYKDDENTGQKRISKAKIISLIVFVLMFLFGISQPNTNVSGFVVFLAAIVFGLFFSVPVFIVGWLIGKLLSRTNKSSVQTTQMPQSNPTSIPNTSRNNTDNKESVPCPHNNALRFKNAIDDNNAELAESILSGWEIDDANYLYARIIFDGMPPSSVELSQLNDWFERAENMSACDNNLRSWFKSTALQVINLH